MKVRRTAGLVLVLASAGAACGYHTAAHAVQLPENVKTISVTAFVNQTREYRIEQLLTSSVVREFATRTHYHILNNSSEAADTVHVIAFIYHFICIMFISIIMQCEQKRVPD